MKKAMSLFSLILFSLITMSVATADERESFFISPADGDTVAQTFTVKFGIKGMDISPAGVERENAGHYHLLIDTMLPDLSFAIPSDPHHLHFGKGQTETSITLSPGEHTLQILLGDHNHVPHDPPVLSEKITVIVE